MPLLPSSHIVGDVDLVSTAPSVRVVTKALLVPPGAGDVTNDPAWGVYDADLRLVEEAAYVRGPGRTLVGQSERSAPVAPTRVLGGEFVYGGRADGHYGHYLLSFLSRYWGGRDLAEGRTILVLQPPAIDGWMELPFVRHTLNALQLDASVFVSVTEPVEVETLVVPACSFVETSRVHEIFSHMCMHIGQRLTHGIPRGATSRPIFLSKEQLGGGIWHIRNERPFLAELEAAGVEIVYPEALSLAEQIALLESRETIGGITGSALHTTAFCTTPKRVVGLGHNHFVASNFVLIDKVKRNAASYWHPEGGLIHEGASERFAATFAFRDPAGAGAAFARRLLGRD